VPSGGYKEEAISEHFRGAVTKVTAETYYRSDRGSGYSGNQASGGEIP